MNNEKILQELKKQLQDEDINEDSYVSNSDLEKLQNIFNEQTFDNEDQLKNLYLNKHNKTKQDIDALVDEIVNRNMEDT